MIENVTLMSSVNAFFFDLDGCIYFTDRLAAGAADLVLKLKDAEKKVCFITNNSRQTSVEVAEKLLHMGLNVSAEEVITATDMTGRYILDQYGVSVLKVAGSASLCASLESAGHRILPLDSQDAADAIVVGRDTDFTYQKLGWISLEAGRGARIIGANADLTHPGRDGEKVPETGALVAAVEAVTGKKASYVGKPEPHLFLYGLQMCGEKAGECAMVGDNYDTDILGGKRAGMHTVWVNSLLKKEDGAADSMWPAADYGVSDMVALAELLFRS